jgi:DNA polymerase V
VLAASEVLKRMFIQGYRYKMAELIASDTSPYSPIQQDLFDVNAEQIQKMRRLDEVVDRINRMHGSETIVIGAQQYTKKDGKGKADVFANAIKHDFKSPNPTTRWGDIMKLNANAKKKKE